mmetsp:Transcript_112467/g.363161  ORF Transcript_112467/g.363161 Transcript_112467/m.363161 type:complete len:246 (-) Transcript_112467:801-1538(-)
MPSITGSMGSPVATLTPTGEFLDSRAAMTFSSFSCTSRPEFSRSVFGTDSMALPKISTPSRGLPSTLRLNCSRCTCAATSKAPAPGTTASSSRVFCTARRPSLMASFICAMLWSVEPWIRIVQLCGFFTPSMKVYFSSSRVCSYTSSAKPRSSSSRSSTAFTATPPTASGNRSMFRRLARRSAMMPSCASISRDGGSMPFWLMTTRFRLFSSVQTFFLSSTIFRTFSSVNLRSDSTSLSRCSEEL